MAKNHGTAALVAALLLIAVTLANAAAEPVAPLICTKPYGVKEHETCFALSQAFGMPLKTFLRFNPNIKCDNLFIGQWVCLAAMRAA